jgi:hypothetical protein
LSRAILSTPQKLKLGGINIQDKTTVNYSCYVMPWGVDKIALDKIDKLMKMNRGQIGWWIILDQDIRDLRNHRQSSRIQLLDTMPIKTVFGVNGIIDLHKTIIPLMVALFVMVKLYYLSPVCA